MRLSNPSTLRFIAVLSLVGSLSGCASYNRIANYPTPNQATHASIVAKPMSKMSELPIGVYYDEPRQIIISGHQKGLGWGMLFGPVGVLVADQANASSAEKRFGESSHGAAVDLGTLAKGVLEEELAAQHAPHWNSAAGPNPLLLSPYALFTVTKSGRARLYAMLRAEILGADGKPTWSVRYFARAPQEYTIEGDEGWMSQGRFAEGMRVALQRTIRVCIEDSQGKLTGTKTVKAKGLFPYMNTERFELPFIVVQEGDQSVVARLAAGDVMVMAGTHVLERARLYVRGRPFQRPSLSVRRVRGFPPRLILRA